MKYLLIAVILSGCSPSLTKDRFSQDKFIKKKELTQKTNAVGIGAWIGFMIWLSVDRNVIWL